jgi:hypothetical protein
MDVPLAVGHVSRLFLAGQEGAQTAALHSVRLWGIHIVIKRCCQVERRHRILHDLASIHARPLYDQTHAQQILVRDGMFQVEPVIAQEFAVVGGIDHQRVVAAAQGLQGVHNAPDIVVDLRIMP